MPLHMNSDRNPSLAVAAVALSMFTVGCKGPPEAPAKLENLCDYVFGHADDEDQAELIAGLENLDTWLSQGDNLASTAEGYTIEKLQMSSVSDLPGLTNPNVSSLMGAAVAIRHPMSMKTLSKTTVVDDWEKVAEGQYVSYKRNFGNQSPGCFPKKNCDELTATSFSESSWAGLIDVESKNKIDFRWVYSDDNDEWYLVHRSWLTEPATVTPDSYGIEVYGQYFLAASMRVNGKTVRMMATWIDTDYGIIPITEDGAKKEIVKSMQQQGEYVDEWSQ